MGNMLFDFILHPAFVVFVLIALFTAVVALVIAHRQKQLSAGFEGDSHFSGRTVRPIPSVHGKPCLLV